MPRRLRSTIWNPGPALAWPGFLFLWQGFMGPRVKPEDREDVSAHPNPCTHSGTISVAGP